MRQQAAMRTASGMNYENHGMLMNAALGICGEGGIGVANECVKQACEMALKYINELEAKLADSKPVKHGHWTITEILCGIGKKRKYYRCSECYKTNVIRSNFCPNCGAKMDGGNDNV